MSTTTIRPRVPFLLWLQEQCLRDNQLLFEVTKDFPTKSINTMFYYGLRQAVERLANSNQQGASNPYVSQLQELEDFNWVGYVSRSLRSAGVKEHDIDSITSEVVVKLLHYPGKLFTGWNGQGPILARFKTSVRNAAINAGKSLHRQVRRRLQSFSDPGVEAVAPVNNPEDVIAKFKAWVQLRLGRTAAEVLDHISLGGEVKELVGQDGLTSYRIKKIVRDLKAELLVFGKDDPDMLQRVRQLLAQEEEVLNKRFGNRRRVKTKSST